MNQESEDERRELEEEAKRRAKRIREEEMKLENMQLRARMIQLEADGKLRTGDALALEQKRADLQAAVDQEIQLIKEMKTRQEDARVREKNIQTRLNELDEFDMDLDNVDLSEVKLKEE